MSHTSTTPLSKFYTRQFETRNISNLANEYIWLWQGETHRWVWI